MQPSSLRPQEVGNPLLLHRCIHAYTAGGVGVVHSHPLKGGGEVAASTHPAVGNVAVSLQLEGEEAASTPSTGECGVHPCLLQEVGKVHHYLLQ